MWNGMWVTWLLVLVAAAACSGSGAGRGPDAGPVADLPATTDTRASDAFPDARADAAADAGAPGPDARRDALPPDGGSAPGDGAGRDGDAPDGGRTETDADARAPGPDAACDAADGGADPCVCREGPCCDGCRFRPAGSPCAAPGVVEHGCPWGVRCGSDVGRRERPRLCSGASAACDGELGEPGPWGRTEDCLAPHGCVEGTCAPSAACEGARCPEARCPLVEDHPGVCNLTTGHCEYDLSQDTDTWVLLTPGTFEMGPAENEIDTDASREDPRHSVTLTRPFLMRTTEITMREWAAVGGDAPGWSSRPENPKQFATWWDVLAWCNLLSEAEGLETCYELTNCTGEPFVHPGGEPMCGACFECDVPPPLDLDCPGYRLPTEAEWEYACRSGSPTELYTGEVWGGERCNAPEIEPLAWYLSNTYYGGGVLLPCGTCPPSGMYLYCSSMPVGLKQPSPWGLYDMLGNAPEFVNDVWGAYPDGPVVDPVEPAGKWEGPWGPNAVGRGGGFGRDAHFTRCTQRLSSNSLRWSSGGLRPVRTLP